MLRVLLRRKFGTSALRQSPGPQIFTNRSGAGQVVQPPEGPACPTLHSCVAMEDHREGRTFQRAEPRAAPVVGSCTRAPPNCLTFQEGTMYSWLVNNMGLNCTGPLPCRLFSINTVECIFSHHFLFFSLLYYVNTVYNVYNIQNTY